MSAKPSRHVQRGAGLVGAMSGFLVFSLLLMFAVQLTFNLYARSQLTAASFDAARRVAGYDHDIDRVAATREAELRLRALLGEVGQHAVIEWDLSDLAVVRLHVSLRPPSVAPGLVRRAAGLDQIDRTIVIRVEQPA